MKILHIISGADPKHGGPIQGIRNYESALNHLAVERSLVCFETPENLKKWEFPNTIKVIGLGNSISRWQYNAVLASWLKKNITNYDKVILNGMWTYHTFATVKVIQKLTKRMPELKVPEVYLMPHGMLDPWFQHSEIRKLKAIRNYFYWQLIEKHVVNNVKGILFTCEEELLISRTTFSGYKPKSELNIGYGISAPPIFNSWLTNEFYTKKDIDASRPYFLFLSRIDPKKGLDLLLSAYSQLLLNANGRNLPDLIIAGHGIDTAYGKSLLDFINQNPHLKPAVKFVGQLSGDLKWGAIYGCEAFVLPSHQENFGIAIVEAMACSKAVLISNKVNIYREIQSGGAGIVNNDTIEGTLKNLNDWISLSAVEKVLMSIRSKTAYVNHFTITNAATRLINALK